MTAVDGHQLARQGRAGAALSVSAIGSFLAGIGAVTALVFVTPILAEFALRFSAPEYFLIAALGITATASMGTGSPIKALMMAVFGLMLALVGTDPILGSSRLTFGETELLEGIDFLPVAIGIFGIGEVLNSLERSFTPIRSRRAFATSGCRRRIGLSAAWPSCAAASWVFSWAFFRGRDRPSLRSSPT